MDHHRDSFEEKAVAPTSRLKWNHGRWMGGKGIKGDLKTMASGEMQDPGVLGA
jgi:hypothetical protein